MPLVSLPTSTGASLGVEQALFSAGAGGATEVTLKGNEWQV